MLLALEAILGHRSAHSLATGPEKYFAKLTPRTGCPCLFRIRSEFKDFVDPEPGAQKCRENMNFLVNFISFL
jgi:hypothetical protein